jgi:ankyrin repeat protein
LFCACIRKRLSAFRSVASTGRVMSDDWFQKEQLHFAAADGDLQRVIKLIENGYDVNAFDEHLAHTPLHYAAREEHIEVVDYLISAGAQINAHEEEKIGETPLGKSRCPRHRENRSYFLNRSQTWPAACQRMLPAA